MVIYLNITTIRYTQAKCFVYTLLDTMSRASCVTRYELEDSLEVHLQLSKTKTYCFVFRLFIFEFEFEFIK